MAAHNYGNEVFAVDDVLNDMERVERQMDEGSAVDDPVTPAPSVPAQGPLQRVMADDTLKPLMWSLLLAAAGLMIFT